MSVCDKCGSGEDVLVMDMVVIEPSMEDNKSWVYSKAETFATCKKCRDKEQRELFKNYDRREENKPN